MTINYLQMYVSDLLKKCDIHECTYVYVATMQINIRKNVRNLSFMMWVAYLCVIIITNEDIITST